MSEFHVQVVRLGPIVKHPDADTLSITKVHDYPVILKTGEFSEGELAVYVPIDAIVPKDDPRWAFLGDHRRIRAKRLRGVFSMGLLTRADPAWELGADVREALGIVKYEPPEERAIHGQNQGPQLGAEDEPAPDFLPIYTDVEGLRRWPDVLVAGEEVILTEKIHGANGRFLWHEDRLWVGSHKRVKRPDSDTIWWRVAHQLGLAERLRAHPGIALYGEVYGRVQDLHYGAGAGELRLALFDALDVRERRYLDADDFLALAAQLGLPTVPVLYRGPWTEALRDHSRGLSTMPGTQHIREGFVVRPIRERFEPRIGRTILKLVGEDYLLRKGG